MSVVSVLASSGQSAGEGSGVDPKSINYVTVGNTIPTESRFAYVARVASIQAGLPMDSVAMSVNRLCSSGLQGIVTTARNLAAGLASATAVTLDRSMDLLQASGIQNLTIVLASIKVVLWNLGAILMARELRQQLSPPR